MYIYSSYSYCLAGRPWPNDPDWSSVPVSNWEVAILVCTHLQWNVHLSKPLARPKVVLGGSCQSLKRGESEVFLEPESGDQSPEGLQEPCDKHILNTIIQLHL